MSGAPDSVVRPLVLALAALALTAATVVGLAGASRAATSAPGGPGVVLAAEDATDLAQQLADATAVQGICYGWDVEVFDASGSDGGTDVGSNGGPGTRVDAVPGCTRSVELHATITYTAESSESEDDASWYVSDTLDHPLLLDSKLPDANGLLDDSTGDVALYNAVAELPLLVAEAGAAPYVTPDPAIATPVPGVALSDQPGSDWWRAHGMALGAGIVFLVAGAAWAAWVWRKERGAPSESASRGSRTRHRSAGSRPAQTRRLP